MRTRNMVYVVVSQWSWDSRNSEIATITLEEIPDQKTFENIVASGTAEEQRSLVSSLRRIVDAQNGSLLGSAKLVALCRITDWSGSNLLDFDFAKDASRCIILTMTPICTFDEQDNILPVVHPATRS